MRGKSIMVQGTASSAGKSTLCAALLRIFRQDGLACAPFKAQNMALNSFVTKAGLEMGRAQVTQAEAAGIEPDARMNPVLLKPTSDKRSQVIVDGKPVGTMSAMEYERLKPSLRARVRATYESLERDFDAVVIEGAGSPAEINLKAGDIVNMAMAEAADAPVLLVGDINLGGVFAALYGTVMLLPEGERARIKGIVINKFRGDVNILAPGLSMIEEKLRIPVIGVVPYLDIDMEDEDSVSERFTRASGAGEVRAVIVRLPHISNFTDFQLLAAEEGVSLRYADRPQQLEEADILLLPGSKNTIEDLIWLKRRGLDAAIARHAARGGMVVGVCGGYQMLGRVLRDPEGVESSVPETPGLGLLDFSVTFRPGKLTRQSRGVIRASGGYLARLNGVTLDGYEIHSGENDFGPGCVPFLYLNGQGAPDGVTNEKGNVLGTYLHGLFDSGELWHALASRVREEKGLAGTNERPLTMAEFREREFDRLAASVRASLDMQAVYQILRGGSAPLGRWDHA